MTDIITKLSSVMQKCPYWLDSLSYQQTDGRIIRVGNIFFSKSMYMYPPFFWYDKD